MAQINTLVNSLGLQMAAKQLLIWDGQLSSSLKQILFLIARHADEGLILLSPTLPDLELRKTLQRSLCMFAQTQGYYQQATHLQIIWLSAVDGLRQLDYHRLLACPAEVSQDDNQDLDVAFSDFVSHALEHYQAQGVGLDEQMLEESLGLELGLNWLDETTLAESLNVCFENWLKPQLQDTAEVRALFWAYLDMKPWSSVELPQVLRPLLDQAIERHLHDPEELGPQLVMSLMRRRGLQPEAESALVAESYGDQDYLALLQPIQNWRVTVMIITYNRLQTFKRSLESVQAQTYQDWELVIIDHGSTDGTAEYCQQVAAQDSRIKLVRKPKNLGVEAIFGYFQEFLESVETELFFSCPDDDWVEPEHLTHLVASFKQRPWMAMSYGCYQLVTRQGQVELQFGPLYHQATVVNPYIELQRLLFAGICPQSMLLRCDALCAYVEHDPTVPEGGRFGSHDFMAGIWLQSSFEVSHVPVLLSSITADANTANAQADLSSIWLNLLKIVAMRYQALYGLDDYPGELLKRYFQHNLNIALNKLVGDVDVFSQAQCIDEQSLKVRLQLVEAFASVWNEYLCLAGSESGLFSQYSAYRALPAQLNRV